MVVTENTQQIKIIIKYLTFFTLKKISNNHTAFQGNVDHQKKSTFPSWNAHIRRHCTLCVKVTNASFKLFGLFFHATPIKQTGVPVSMMISPITHSMGLLMNGKMDRNTMITRNRIGHTRQTLIGLRHSGWVFLRISSDDMETTNARDSMNVMQFMITKTSLVHSMQIDSMPCRMRVGKGVNRVM